MKISHSYQSTPSNHFLWLKDCVSFHFPGFPTSKTGGTKKNSSSTKGEELSKWCPFFVGVIPRLTSSQCCKMSCSSQEKLPFDAHKREKERNMFGSRKYFDRMGFPISENCCLASKKKCWKNRSRCMSEFIVLKMERIKALNPSGLGRGVWWNCVARWWWFPKKRKFWPKWWPCVGCPWGRQTVEFEVIEVYGRSAFTEFWDPLNRLIHG